MVTFGRLWRGRIGEEGLFVYRIVHAGKSHSTLWRSAAAAFPRNPLAKSFFPHRHARVRFLCFVFWSDLWLCDLTERGRKRRGELIFWSCESIDCYGTRSAKTLTLSRCGAKIRRSSHEAIIEPTFSLSVGRGSLVCLPLWLRQFLLFLQL